MKYTKNHIPFSDDKRPGTEITPTSITIHSTANPSSTAQNELDWLTNPSNDRTASWHIVVDDIEAIEAIPLNEIAYHAGSSEGNRSSIGIEITESGDRSTTLSNAAELVARMLNERNWDLNKLKRHFDWSGKVCPRIFADNNWAGWNQYLDLVQVELDKYENENESENRNLNIFYRFFNRIRSFFSNLRR